MKEKEMNWFLIGIAIALVLIYAYMNTNANPPLAGSQSGYDFGSGNTGNSYVDLSSMFSAIMENSTFRNSCSSAGGEWWNTPTKVGCYNTVVSINLTQCSLPAFQAAMAMCNAAGADTVCDVHNVGCKY